MIQPHSDNQPYWTRIARKLSNRGWQIASLSLDGSAEGPTQLDARHPDGPKCTVKGKTLMLAWMNLERLCARVEG